MRKKRVVVDDLVQTDYVYYLTEPVGKNFAPDFRPELSPANRIPLLFALGTASVTMVGTNVGAGQHERARRIAWTGAALSAVCVGAIGLAAALVPEAWLRLFTSQPEVIAAGAAYLSRVAPFYAFFGAGMSIYFASQGAGRMAWPFAAGMARLGIVCAAGFSGIASLGALYGLVAAGYVAFGAINVFALARGYAWRRAPRLVPEAQELSTVADHSR